MNGVLFAMGYDGMWGHGWGWGGWLAMSIVMVVFWAGLIAAAVVAVRYLSGAVGPEKRPRRALAEHLLEERFARGDIDEEDYRRRLTVLRESR